jgi:hypothetical protein
MATAAVSPKVRSGIGAWITSQRGEDWDDIPERQLENPRAREIAVF